jgi:hypothetical protein
VRPFAPRACKWLSFRGRLPAPPEPSAEPAPASDCGSFTWPLTSWSTRCKEESIRSDVLIVAGRKWCAGRVNQNASCHGLLNTERVGRRLLLYPRGSGGAPPGFVSLFLDSTAEERVFPLDKVDFTLVLRGTGTPDVTKSALRLQHDCQPAAQTARAQPQATTSRRAALTGGCRACRAAVCESDLMAQGLQRFCEASGAVQPGVRLPRERYAVVQRGPAGHTPRGLERVRLPAPSTVMPFSLLPNRSDVLRHRLWQLRQQEGDGLRRAQEPGRDVLSQLAAADAFPLDCFSQGARFLRLPVPELLF